MCGKSRPGHFKAVVDVVERFIKIINPNRIYFGKKDMQQFILIKKYVKKKYPNIKIIACRTIREKNGIAYSSRNQLLSINEKKIASKIFKILSKKKSLIFKNKISFNYIKKYMKNLGIKKIDYIKLLDMNKIIKPYKKKPFKKIFIAYYIGKTRLIDNI